MVLAAWRLLRCNPWSHGGVDFVEVFQFGELKSDPWYELLNAGFRVTGIAGSDFPANFAYADASYQLTPPTGKSA